MKFAFAPFGSEPLYDPAAAAACDGLPPGRVSLSHWPGHATPPDLRHDLSTGIALAFARLTKDEREARFGRLEFAVNNHFDTDGLLAIFACVNPEAALARAEAMLLAASAGDHWRMPARRSAALDMAVSCYTDPERSPLGSSLTKLTDAQRDALAYTELLARLPEALDNPWSLGCRIEEELARAEEDLTFLRTKARIAFHPARHLAVAEIDRPVDTRALFEACGTDRILELRSTSQGLYAALRVSSLSWFETTKGRFPERPNLDAVAARLQQGERAVGSWIAGSAEDPFPAVEFGARAEPGGFRSPAVKPIPTGQSPAAVVEAVLACL